MKIGVVGSQSFLSYDLLEAILDTLRITEMFSGGAEGADRLAERYAIERSVEMTVFPVEWDKFPGKSAAYHRNKMIVEASDAVVAFWDGVSKGTRMTMKLCWEARKPLTIIRTDLLLEDDE